MITNQEENHRRIQKIVDDFTLFDDTFMSMVFDNNIPAAQRLLSIVLNRDDIKVIRVTGQKQLQASTVEGRIIRLDILVQDSIGKLFNVEVQRSDAGAVEQRARYHSSMLDGRMLKHQQKFEELPDSYVIFITENDYFKAGLPIYTVNRHIEELNQTFLDGSHIIYVNGSYQGKDALGMMLEDFRCKKGEDMHYPEFADGVKYYKEDKGGRGQMCKAMEDFARDYAEEYAKEYAEEYAKEYAEEYAKDKEIKAAVKTAVKYGVPKESILADICNDYALTVEEAEEAYEEYAGVVLV